MSDDTPVVRCWNCNLNQFQAVACRRCREPLEKPVEQSEALRVRESGTTWREVGYHEAVAARIGRRVKAARQARGWSQKRFAEIVGCQRTYLTKVESGVLQPQIYRLESFSKALGLTIADLIESKKEMQKRLIFADPFMRELINVSGKMPPFYWKKIADHAERLSNGKSIAVSS